jgi:MarR family transcriptional regulator, organic hydroperoxide resistance regulator
MTTPRPERASSADLRHELRQSRPFRSESQEAILALMRTASVVSRRVARVVEPHGISLAQYNVLRILRGAGPEGLPTLAIRERMVEEGTTITRLLDKLEAAHLVRRCRTPVDRRQVLCFISDAGQALLTSLDPQVDAANDAIMQVLDHAACRQLIDTLATIRVGSAGSPSRTRDPG